MDTIRKADSRGRIRLRGQGLAWFREVRAPALLSPVPDHLARRASRNPAWSPSPQPCELPRTLACSIRMPPAPAISAPPPGFEGDG